MKGKKLGCLAAVAVLSLTTTALAQTPKYVFFFIGDGMSSSQIQAAEAYLTTKNGGSATEAKDLLKSENRLNLSKFPVLGMQTTYDAHALMTDSASAGTAFACGIKTLSGVIGMDDTKTISYKSVAQLAEEQGKRVGIISTVSLDHATPAAFYASVASRGYMNNIATQMVEADYDFFGGGGLVAPTASKTDGDTSNNVWELLEENGYTVLKDRASILALNNEPQGKVVCINPVLQDSSAMPYAIDRDENSLSLAEMTEVAIHSLQARTTSRFAHSWKNHKHGWGNQGDGFFLMVEGGKIDWACHANDAMAAIGDTLAFDDAVGVALDFYRQHPMETLIVVTGDHETGGMTIGHATTGYTGYYQRLLGQNMSFTAFGQSEKWKAIKEKYANGYDNTDSNLADDADMVALLEQGFGINLNESSAACESDSKKICLNDYQKKKLEDAFDKSIYAFLHQFDKNDPENKLLYGGYEPIAVTITHILNEMSSVGWTSYSHTGVPVPVFAIGQQSQRFAGFYDNTDIAKQIARSMGVRQQLPVERTN
ncbi:MAG: alkaline phosphatase [Desulfobulbus sp.]